MLQFTAFHKMWQTAHCWRKHSTNVTVEWELLYFCWQILGCESCSGSCYGRKCLFGDTQTFYSPVLMTISSDSLIFCLFMNRRGLKKMPFSSRSKRANGASSSTCPHQYRSFHPAGRSHCHGNHFCTRSGTSRAGWHSGSGCGTGSGPLHTHRYLRKYMQVSEHKLHTFHCNFISVRPHFGRMSTQIQVSQSLFARQRAEVKRSAWNHPYTLYRGLCSGCTIL